MRQFFAKFPNAVLRFFDVSRYLAEPTSPPASRISADIETYYRFIIQEALKPFGLKLLYMDCDLVVNGDIAELFDTELGDRLCDRRSAGYRFHRQSQYEEWRARNTCVSSCICATHTATSSWRAGDEPRAHARDPYGARMAGNRLQAGYIYNDQDSLNVECEGQVSRIWTTRGM